MLGQRKPIGKLRLLVDLRKINTLIADVYIHNNHPVSSLTDAAQQMAGKNLFCKLDYSQAYRFPNLSQSIELLALNFASRKFTYQRLAQDLVVPYRHFRASYANFSIQSSKSINVHNSSTVLA